jgi:hypothetical protein
MSTTLFFVRAVVAENLREKFDHWYSTAMCRALIIAQARIGQKPLGERARLQPSK